MLTWLFSTEGIVTLIGLLVLVGMIYQMGTVIRAHSAHGISRVWTSLTMLCQTIAIWPTVQHKNYVLACFMAIGTVLAFFTSMFAAQHRDTDLDGQLLLTLKDLGGKSDTASLRNKLDETLGNTVSAGALSRSLNRLMEQHLIEKSYGEVKEGRGGRREVIVQLTQDALAQMG